MRFKQKVAGGSESGDTPEPSVSDAAVRTGSSNSLVRVVSTHLAPAIASAGSFISSSFRSNASREGSGSHRKTRMAKQRRDGDFVDLLDPNILTEVCALSAQSCPAPPGYAIGDGVTALWVEVAQRTSLDDAIVKLLLVDSS